MPKRRYRESTGTVRVPGQALQRQCQVLDRYWCHKGGRCVGEGFSWEVVSNSQAKEMILWNLVHGCHWKSEGAPLWCFAHDEKSWINTNLVRKTASFALPLKRKRKSRWKITPGSMVMTYFPPTSSLWRWKHVQQGLADKVHERWAFPLL